MRQIFNDHQNQTFHLSTSLLYILEQPTLTKGEGETLGALLQVYVKRDVLNIILRILEESGIKS
jgi:hypothetical protein